MGPNSRPSSPALAPTSVHTNQVDGAPVPGGSRTLSSFYMSSFRRPSPLSSTTTATSNPLTTLVQDGTYLDVLSLKLSEAVSKALAQPNGPAVVHELLGNKKPIPPGRGHTLGALITTEINATRANPHLQKAVMRSLQRPLSALLSNISAHLLPLLTSPAFPVVVLNPQSPNLNATQIHAVGLATLAGEVLETFDDLSLGLDNDIRPYGLRVTRDGLLFLVKRVVDPLVSAIQNEMTSLINSLENVDSLNIIGSGLNVKASKTLSTHHPSIVTLQSFAPIYAKALARIAASRAAQSHLASMLIKLVWHSVLALSHRSLCVPTPPPSPPTGLKMKKINLSITPSASPPSARPNIKLPATRPSSPNNIIGSTHAYDAMALYDLLSLLPRPSKDNATTILAFEAVDEAFEGLASLVSLFEFLQARSSLAPSDELEAELESVTENIPTLIGLPIILRTFVYPGSQDSGMHSVASMLRTTDAEYRNNCLTGFNRADECEEVVGKHLIHVLRSDESTQGALMVAKWLEKQIQNGC